LTNREATPDIHWASGRPRRKGAALIGAFAIIVAAWWWDASLLTAAADGNLQPIKIVTSKLPFDWGSKIESALRIFGADRALLLIEGVAIAKVVMLGFAYPFRRRR
jgi:ferric-dicitrate binding protein FerR (iron transport regulator)